MDIACQYGCEGGIMRHVHGASFACDACGRDWQPDWVVIGALDRLACERSLDDGPSIEDAIRIATGELSGEHEPAADDLPAMLGVPELPTAIVIAWACFRREYDARQESAA